MAKKKAIRATVYHRHQKSHSTRKSDTLVASFGRKQWLALAFILLVTGVVFSRVFVLDFVNWDDPENLLENKNLKPFANSWDWNAVKAIFTSDVIGGYNPLSIFTFAIEKYFFAPDPEAHPFVFHFNNWLLHLGCTALVYVLLTQLGLSLPGVILGSLFFGIHPMRVESVAWVTERKDVLFGFFFLAALTAYIRYIRAERSKTRWYIIAVVLSVFSYLAKIQAVTLPLSMVAIDFFLKRNWYSFKTLVVEKLPWWLLSLAIGLINIYFLSNERLFEADRDFVDYSFIDRLAVGAYTYAVYIIKWIYPYAMSPLYPYPKQLPLIAYMCLVLLPLGIVLFLLWAWKKQKTGLLFGWAFFTFNVMFLLQIVGAGQAFLADRFTYIAYIGLFFISAKGFEWATTQFYRFKNLVIIFTAIYLLVFIVLTYRQIGIWHNGGTMWEHVKSLYPNNPLAWKQAGFYYREKAKDYERAIENYKKAISLQPDDAYVYNGLAKAYIDKAFSMNAASQQQGRQAMLQQSLQYYHLALQQDSATRKLDNVKRGEIWVNLGVACAALGDNDRALASITKGLELNQENANGYMNRGLIYFQKARYEAAIADYERYLKLNPYNANIYNDLALSKTALGRFDEAISHYNKAIALNPKQPLFYLNRARAFKYVGRKQEMLRDIQQAKALGASIPYDLIQ